MVSSLQASSNCLKILSFKSTFSVAASTTKLAYSTPSVILVNKVMFSKVVVLSSSVILSLETIRSKFFAIVSTPRFSDASLRSISWTLNPDCANVWAIPFPIVPAPITAMFFIFLFFCSTELVVVSQVIYLKMSSRYNFDISKSLELTYSIMLFKID